MFSLDCRSSDHVHTTCHHMYNHANTKFAAVGSNTTWSRVTVRALVFPQ